MANDTTEQTLSKLLSVGAAATAIKASIVDEAAFQSDRVSLTIKDLTINGFVSQNSSVANFRNIQYARIPARWRQAVSVDPTKEKGLLDATQWGPRPPQPIDALHHTTSHLYPRMSTLDRQSEFECLNLNVYGPVTALNEKGRGVPVLVWIHGGSFIFGDGGCEFDGQYLVRRSIELKEPIIVVGFNYRLGILGFFASKELREEARSYGEPGFNNLGLHDQRLALQWVRQNIHYFGGDGSRMTVAGESAGACSILAHLRGQVPVFQNALLMSPASLAPAHETQAQLTFDHLVAELGLSDVPTGQKLSALRSIDSLKLFNLAANRMVPLCDDSEFFSDWRGQQFENILVIPSWVKKVVVGGTKEETALFSHRWTATPAEELYGEWQRLYPDSAYAQEVLSVYGVDKSSTQVELRAGHIAYTTDSLFGMVVNSVAKTHLGAPHPSNPKVYQYSFDQPDILSTDPILGGSAYHSEDNAFLFYFPQVAGPSAPVEFKATADVFNGAVLKLINDKEPWEEISVARRYMSFNGDNSRLKEDGESSYKRYEKLVDTPERLGKFLLGMNLFLKAMVYGMTATVERAKQ